MVSILIYYIMNVGLTRFFFSPFFPKRKIQGFCLDNLLDNLNEKHFVNKTISVLEEMLWSIFLIFM